MAKVDKAEIAKQLLTLALGMGAGASPVLSMVGGGGLPISGAGGAGLVGGLPPGASAFAASNYPTEFAPDWAHNYKVINIPGPANMNQHGQANKSVISEAGRMQTLDEHNAAIMKYVKPGMDPKTLRAALHRGLEEEKNLAAFWNESESRRPFSVSSSAISGIRLTPDGRVEVRWHTSPKWYTFKEYPNVQEASLAAQQLLLEPSIGRAVYPVISRKLKKPNPLLGGWNQQNYDAAYA